MMGLFDDEGGPQNDSACLVVKAVRARPPLHSLYVARGLAQVLV